ncbi:hypothetical protein [Actinophytocola glycyrrhizae]|uniref:Phospholipase D-like protein n=1 Tax=Actinophytocola glycyrrhizae TaxID=2044873 RepID=A0ABV9S4E8_9PSEU
MTMDKLVVFLLVTSPFLGFVAWATWWLATDSLSARRRAWAVDGPAKPTQNGGSNDERSHCGQASAA